MAAGDHTPDGLFSTLLGRVHTSLAREVSPDPYCRCNILAALGGKRGHHGVPRRAGNDGFHAQPECKRCQSGALRRCLTPEGLPEQSARYIGISSPASRSRSVLGVNWDNVPLARSSFHPS